MEVGKDIQIKVSVLETMFDKKISKHFGKLMPEEAISIQFILTY